MFNMNLRYSQPKTPASPGLFLALRLACNRLIISILLIILGALKPRIISIYLRISRLATSRYARRTSR